MKFTKQLFALTLLFGLSLTVKSQQKESLDVGTLDTYLNAIHLKKGFNGEIFVAKGNNIIFQKTVGMASYENSVKLKNGAKYRIASITKTFTGTLIAIAQEEQKLNVQDKASGYLNGLSPKFKNITIEQLLYHTSGLPHNEGIKDYWQTKSKLQTTREQAIEEINTLDLLFESGSQMQYSSLGYYLLASILENVYKNSFENILRDKILNKLQMTETGIVDNLKIIPQMASGYHLVTDDSLVVAPYRNYSMLKGAGDMYSTTTDLLKWNNSFFSNSLLSEKSKEIVFAKTTNSKSKNGNSYGYGWYLNSDIPKKFYHGGGTWGYSTFTSIYADNDKTSIIILSNVSTLPITNIASDVEKIVFGKPFQMPSIEKVSEKPIDLEMYIGEFITEENKMVLNIIKAENSLYAKLGENPPFEIYPKGNHQFFGKKVEIEFTFAVNDINVVTGLTANGMGKSFQFKKDNK
ncbi:serine hydrolase [Flavivirga sp. 57AJ16]|uniref:serine hydrolase domain-containing protein n=1 Tax=Flavivirga sp. 57AJ16 TaxID=3025307 RepID=UPI0023650EFB|nr:serine hydrolase domain-containing protein [Flavivirga sp. 57AJ16]MDD7888193.1 serine hydrolase [Flavivirga sp. 57AJ16]